MRTDIEKWSIVTLGAWNTAILTPGWLRKHLAVDGPVQIEFPIDNPLLPIRYLFQSVKMAVLQDRLILAPSADDPIILQRVESLARGILQVLTHTPVTAVGVNFAFVEAEPSPLLKGLFRAQDLSKLADADFIVSGTELHRQLHRGKDTINLVLRQDGPEVAIQVNFHKDTPDATAALTYLEDKVTKYRDLAAKFLQDVYNLELEGRETT